MSAPPPLRRLQHALAVTREALFRRAAARINVSQPSLSRQIKELEIENSIEVSCRKHSKIMPQDASASAFRKCLARRGAE
jgi:Mn-dependent DtxR family transcriptional regulator